MKLSISDIFLSYFSYHLILIYCTGHLLRAGLDVNDRPAYRSYCISRLHHNTRYIFKGRQAEMVLNDVNRTALGTTSIEITRLAAAAKVSSTAQSLNGRVTNPCFVYFTENFGEKMIFSALSHFYSRKVAL